MVNYNNGDWPLFVVQWSNGDISEMMLPELFDDDKNVIRSASSKLTLLLVDHSDFYKYKTAGVPVGLCQLMHLLVYLSEEAPEELMPAPEVIAGLNVYAENPTFVARAMNPFRNKGWQDFWDDHIMVGEKECMKDLKESDSNAIRRMTINAVHTWAKWSDTKAPWVADEEEADVPAKKQKKRKAEQADSQDTARKRAGGVEKSAKRKLSSAIPEGTPVKKVKKTPTKVRLGQTALQLSTH